MHNESVHLKLLTLIGVILAIGAMRVGYPVIMPAITALFIIATAWPVKNWLDARMPTVLSYIGTVIMLMVLFLGFFALMYYAVAQVAQHFYDHQEEFRALYNRYTGWAEANGLPVFGNSGGFDRLTGIARSLLSDVYTILSYLGLIAVIVIMGLPEIPALGRKFAHEFDRDQSRELYVTSLRIAANFRSYVIMTVISSLITGVASTAWALAIGLDLATLWGVLNFLLNFIPVVGNIAGIVPPTLYALIQYDGWTMPAVVFAGYAVLQIVISNFVYPMLQSRGLSLPPVSIILSLLFWSWLWGFAGALLAVPLTAAFIIGGRQFSSTRRIAYLLTQDDHDQLE
ncbi:AI-2E family transporter [Salinisphaera sp. T31B1]|uniref:AI-2E family transporter n=1 Tax=Salinisphaera sp. T31B1 TaxID=727963 RepID=UPI00333F9A99